VPGAFPLFSTPKDTTVVVNGVMAWVVADVNVAALETSPALPENRNELCCVLLVELVAIPAAAVVAAAAARACEKSSLYMPYAKNLYPICHMPLVYAICCAL